MRESVQETRDRLEEFARNLRDRRDSVEEERRRRLRAFSTVLQEKLGAHDRALRRLDRYLSTHFNVFTFIGRDENRLSDVFADLLRTDGTHGQGDRFFRAFLTQLPLDVPRDELRATVRREERTARSQAYARRIDILIEFDGKAVAIENKLWAADQKNQLRDYARHLSKRYPSKWCLVYLTPDGRAPSEFSIGHAEATSYRNEERLVQWSHARHIIRWVKSCIETCESEKYRWFLRDLLEHVTREFPASREPKEESQDGVD